MSARKRVAAAAAGLTTAVVAALVTAGPVTAATGSTPGWEPDHNAVGTVTFYNASGSKITGGSLDASPMAAFAQGSASGTSGDNKATLYAYSPTKSSPSTWDCHDKVMGTTDYPNSGAPGSLGSSQLPVVTGQSGDLSLKSFVQDCPNRNTDPGYAGYYQLRLVTSGPGHVGDPRSNYDAVDIVVSGNSWSLASSSSGPKVLTNTGRPRVLGVHRVGHKQTCSTGSWSPTPSSFGYAWYRGSTKIAHATKRTFTPTKSFAGKRLSCKVTAHKSGYTAASARSAKVTIKK